MNHAAINKYYSMRRELLHKHGWNAGCGALNYRYKGNILEPQDICKYFITEFRNSGKRVKRALLGL
jgi:hypothetical protein